MYTPTDKDYFRERAADELARADAATDSVVAKIHRELAERYQRLVELSRDTPSPR